MSLSEEANLSPDTGDDSQKGTSEIDPKTHAFWTQRLADLPPLALPQSTDAPPYSKQVNSHQLKVLKSSITNSLGNLDGCDKSSAVHTLLGAAVVWLARFAHQEDLAIAVPHENPSAPGHWPHASALRMNLGGKTTFREILKRIEREELETASNRLLPTQALVEMMEAPGQNMAMFHYHPWALPTFEDLQKVIDLKPWNLALVFAPEGLNLKVFLVYDETRFAGLATDMWESFHTLINAIIKDPNCPVFQLPMASAEQEQKLLLNWEQTEYPRNQTVTSLFEKQVAASPDGIAVQGAGSLTFSELNRKANGLGRFLTDRGVCRGDMVAICQERSPQLLVSILGVLKAGAAYVPLDPSYPLERKALILEDVNPAIIIADPDQSLPDTPASIINLQDVVLEEIEENPSSQGTGEDPAYVLYTSGSTGRPKGAVVPHRAIARLVLNTNYIELNEQDRIGYISNVSFDAATLEIWGALLCGARLIVISQETLLAHDRFIETIREQGVTVMFLTSALFSQIALEDPSAFKTMHTLMAGGDRVDPVRARSVLENGPPLRLLNGYGPTENTTFTTVHHIIDVTENASQIPIGKPIANTRTVLVDEAGNLVPPGVPGELWAGGDGLALGYLNRPELTQEKFVTGLKAEPQTRWYRTGDLCRQDQNGVIEFMGRMDDQVKIRGFRIEPGEVEHCLCGHHHVGEALILVKTGGTGEKYLAGYVTAKKGESQMLEAAGLKDWLSEKLPPYMVPTSLTILEKFPITPNGKVDRAALARLESMHPQKEASFIPPQGSLEILLARLWEELLAQERVGRGDNFFELGGHSLTAGRLFTRLANLLDLDLSLVMLFKNPTLENFAAELQTLGQSKGLDLSSALKGEKPASPASYRIPPLKPRSSGARLIASFAQQRLWFLDRLDPGSTLYNIPMALDLKGPLKVESLKQALNTLCQRHESLRTGFSLLGDEPVQIVRPALQEPLLNNPALQFTGSTTSQLAALVAQAEKDEAEKAFNLEKDDLIRCRLLVLDPEHHKLLLTFHHIVFDGWSVEIFLKELSALYQGFCNEQESGLEEPTLQYADFAIWQRGWLRGEILEKQMAYWKDQLADGPVLALLTDKPRPAVMTFAGASEEVHLPKTLVQALHQVASETGTTLYMTLLSAFQVLLSRYANQTDITVASPIANRHHMGMESLIGFFVNTLVMRANLENNPTFRQLLQQNGETTLKAYENQDLPFEQLVETLAPERDRSRNPLAQVLFALQNMPDSLQHLSPDVTLDLSYIPTNTAKFDLTLALFETADGLNGTLEYRTDLFERETALRLLRSFEVLLEDLTTREDCPIGELALLTPEDMNILLTHWNQTQKEYPRDRSIVDLFEEWVSKTPQAPAVSCNGEILSYEVLNLKANQLAHCLIHSGVAPGDRVVLSLDRSVKQIISTLAILKSGAAYVPLDPGYPMDRKQLILDEVKAAALITDSLREAELPPNQKNLINLDLFTEQGPETNPNLTIQPLDVAHVLFTSGSTGRPKGVLIPHRGVVRLLVNTNYLNFHTSDRVAHVANISFDMATFEIWGAFLNGAQLVIFNREEVLSSRFVERFQEEKVTIMVLPTALFNQIVLEDPHAFNTLKGLVFGGERADPDRIRDVLQTQQAPILVNGYGPTENSVITTSYSPKFVPPGATSVPIGRPIANTTVVLVDRYLQPTPVGVSGELWASGDGLTLGYLNRDDLTAEKFVENLPWAPGVRWYRTGDLCRYFPDGQIDFLGRLDNQVKIRGFRIEPGEVEAVLADHPMVADCLVLVRKNQGDAYLSAFVILRDFVDDVEPLQNYLVERLPAYMVPAVITAITGFPLTPNGKVDHKALCDLEAERDASIFTPPETALEQWLAETWQALLKGEAVGKESNFFDLGGHSLLATRLFARIYEKLGLEVPITMLFDTPVLSHFAHRLESVKQDQEPAHRVSGRSEPSNGHPIISHKPIVAPPLSFAQQRLWFLDRLDPAADLYNVPLSIRFKGCLDREILKRALNELVQRHESLRTLFQMVNDHPIQVIRSEWDTPLLDGLDEDLSQLPPEEKEKRQRQCERENASQGFDLSQGPLIRARLLQLNTNEHLLLVCIHHIVFDGWSTEILMKELNTLYGDFHRGLPSSLSPLPIQYANYAVWQREWLQGETLKRQQDYWMEKLNGVPVLDLPTDRPRPVIPVLAGATQPVKMPLRLSQSLRTFSKRNRVTLYMTLLSAFQVLLSRYSRQTDIAVATPIANRPDPKLDRLIGFFVNTLVLRGNLSDNPSFTQFTSTMRQTILEGYDHQDIPFEQLVELLVTERDRSRNPLAQVLFVLNNFSQDVYAPSPNLKMQVEPGRLENAKFDLSLVLTDSPDGVAGHIEYRTALFNPETIQRMWCHFKTLLKSIVTQPQCPVFHLPLLTSDEKKELLTTWNPAPTPYPREATVMELFQEQAATHPDAIAIIEGSTTLTYDQLNRRANGLAHHLISLGFTPGQMTPLCMDRSVEMLIGILAVLKAGGVYVPLDPKYPVARQQLIIEDVQARWLLTSNAWHSQVPPSQARVMNLNDVIWQDKDGNPNTLRGPLDPAYVLYTSGSTGRPKGVIIPHRAIIRLVKNTNFMTFQATDCLPHLSNLSFDASTFEIWGAFLNGARLLIIPHDTVISLNRLLPLLRDQAVTCLFATVALFGQIVQEAPDAFNGMRTVMFGGERAEPARARAVLQAGGPQHLLNVYGPTENTVFTTFYEINEVAGDATSIPIGFPVANTRCVVVDSYKQLAPVGVAGELWTSGDGLALEYLGQKDLTDQFFVTGLREEPETRWYRTGDLCRILPGGTIHFLGRLDHQVKLRGFRIEPGEIAACLETHDQVTSCVVLARKLTQGDMNLAAYVMSPNNDESLPALLREYLKSRMPPHMIPSMLLVMEHFPINANGKVDRNALARMELKAPRVEYLPPQTSLEILLAEVWEELLEVEAVGSGDNFFELGGHSLMATRFFSRISEMLGMDPPLSMLFDHPVLKDFSRHFRSWLEGRDDALDILAWLDEAAALYEDESQQTGELGESMPEDDHE